jgi:hypothetical protein
MADPARARTRTTPHRWRGRPVLAASLQTTLVLLPVLAATVAVRVGVQLSPALPWYARVAVGLVLAVVVAAVAERWLRRFLPLTALLRMTMLFPDRAPSRLAVARRIGHPRRLADLAAGGRDETLAEAAERILVLVATLGAHDRRTRGHSERVRVFTDLVSEQLGLDRDARDRLRWAALLHDLGKVSVPARVLNKPGALDPAEWDLIRAHPARGVELAGPLTTWLGPWAAAIGEHHERFDGTGYPRGLRGHEIALAGRAVAVADTFEVMTAARSYKRPMSVRAARVELARVAGTQLDPVCVRALLSASLPRLLWAVGPLSLLVNLPLLRSLADAGRLLDPTAAGLTAPVATTAAAALTGVAVVASPLASAAATPPAHRATTTAPAHHADPAPSGGAGTGPRSPTTPTATPTALPSPTTAAPHPEGPTGAPTTTRAPDPASPSASPTRPSTAHPGAGSGRPTTPTPATTGPSTSPTPSAATTSNSGPGTAGEDRTPPTVTITAAPLLRLLTDTAQVSFTSDDAAAVFSCRLDGDPWRSCTSPVTYSGLRLGTHRVEVRATDAAGNQSDPERVEFTVVSLGVAGL